MNHLDIDTIIDYVMIDKINEETKTLAGIVCAHTIRCKECATIVDAFQTVYESLRERMEKEEIYENLMSIATKNIGLELMR